VNREPDIGPVCQFSEVSSADNMWFLVLEQYYSLGFALSLLSLFSIAIYFVTSSDSGRLVVDFLASNGEMHHDWIQRFFWACTEGAVAIALIVAGRQDSLRVLQSASILAGLPFTVFVSYLMLSLFRLCRDHQRREDGEDLGPTRGFSMSVYGGVFNIIELGLSCGTIPSERGFMSRPSKAQWTESVLALVLPFRVFKAISERTHPDTVVFNLTTACVDSVLLWSAILLLIFGLDLMPGNGLGAFALYFYLGHVFLVAALRNVARERLDVRGNLFEGIVCSFFF